MPCQIRGEVPIEAELERSSQIEDDPIDTRDWDKHPTREESLLAYLDG